MKSSSVTIQMKATERYFPVVLFIMLYSLVPCLESVVEMVDSIRTTQTTTMLSIILFVL